ncbi:hypothetical protein HRR83_002720 [Exophiala dermatitidis]|uniref:UbiE/COQ5 methyltransferase n=2 Tax=Exophiala dermatitidis TaxID=5970 RepID=H6C0D3_EXODN
MAPTPAPTEPEAVQGQSQPIYTQGHSAPVLASHLSRTVSNSAAFLLPYLYPCRGSTSSTSTAPDDSVSARAEVRPAAASELEDTFTIVDLGCGPGTITAGFCDYLPSPTPHRRSKVIGIDASAQVIKQARQKFPESEYPSLSFVVGDISADRLPFDDDSVDVVYTHQTLLHVSNPELVLREVYRILKPGHGHDRGGILAMREAVGMTFQPESAGTNQYISCLDRAVRATGASGFLAGRSLHLWATRAGFSRDKMQVGAGAQCYAGPGPDSEAAWWAGVHVARLEGEIGEKWLGMQVVETQEEIKQMKRALREWGDRDDAWAAVWQGEVLCWK